MSNKRQKKLLIPKDVCRRFEEVADQQEMYQSELITELITDIYGVDEDAPEYLRRQRAELEDREEEVINQITELESELTDIQDEKSEITERISEIESQQRELDEIMTDILAEMETSDRRNILGFRKDITEACQVKYGSISESKRQEIIHMLRTRALESDDYDIAEHRFDRATAPTGAGVDSSSGNSGYTPNIGGSGSGSGSGPGSGAGGSDD